MSISLSVASACPDPVARPAGRRLTGTEAVVVIVIVVTAGALALAGLSAAAVTGPLGAATYTACRAVTGLRGSNAPAPDTV
ncbi:hypothetical protein GCM10009759_69050 [Kitasatospora saccharophila]|uniref:Uncharacterized protein n=1 Tax=Kitasatospora saccharophila TaxID=407973 RepID=A0ABN2Y2W5_9ACTN